MSKSTVNAIAIVTLCLSIVGITCSSESRPAGPTFETKSGSLGCTVVSFAVTTWLPRPQTMELCTSYLQRSQQPQSSPTEEHNLSSNASANFTQTSLRKTQATPLPPRIDWMYGRQEGAHLMPPLLAKACSCMVATTSTESQAHGMPTPLPVPSHQQESVLYMAQQEELNWIGLAAVELGKHEAVAFER